eukprot:TRINITY_DN24745_c0_g2_i2.p1 TRINITY_DN24745_c0_g2~~TRINITY_DN24745_c0_g2_i2.p1  ORF type:complete len:330 (-),score=50.89 TRINITY_DN24745_c0_g2_i2:1-990(-)
MIRPPPRSTLSSSSAASDVYKRQGFSRTQSARNPWRPTSQSRSRSSPRHPPAVDMVASTTVQQPPPVWSKDKPHSTFRQVTFQDDPSNKQPKRARPGSARAKSVTPPRSAGEQPREEPSGGSRLSASGPVLRSSTPPLTNKSKSRNTKPNSRRRSALVDQEREVAAPGEAPHVGACWEGRLQRSRAARRARADSWDTVQHKASGQGGKGLSVRKKAGGRDKEVRANGNTGPNPNRTNAVLVRRNSTPVGVSKPMRAKDIRLRFAEFKKLVNCLAREVAGPGNQQAFFRKKVYPLLELSLIHISEPTRLLSISYAVFCLKKKKKTSIIKE